ncbi:helix-turn-helix domain-containing protein [Xylanibacter muris]|uniref:Helix-turn-helix domain-containing protein n=4 Tax=Bacteroidales TaxID=171549 RepID=A0ABX2AMG1_9BACT|nr:helix-turn-helix domain-containing protein [Xylanibacter muris]NPD91772.1 helix-turn-helix domain-containing protein [Xylanibacter muris]RXE71071.1 DNA-binding protein [Muribaculaceae bacterium Isolate-002 (NCI)]
MTDFLNLPFVEVLKLLVRGSVEAYLSEKEASASTDAEAAKPECESLDMNGALAFLNANGYPIKRGQLYKETSKGTIPFQKFGRKLHFKKSQLLEWAESKLIDGNAVGVLVPATVAQKGGKR